MRFSQRKGLKPIKSFVQKDDIDGPLRSGLWDALTSYVWEKYTTRGYGTFRKSNLFLLFQIYWHEYFNWPLDNLPQYFGEALKVVREYFFKCPWNELYDFIEFTAQSAPEELTDGFITFCNCVLERELSAYRLVDKHILEITSDEEIETIEEAIANTSKLKGVQAHLKTALNLLADRKEPDYRNSIKESISAVEAISQVLSGDVKATLGEALKVFEQNELLHPALKKKSFVIIWLYIRC